jgi:scyllo-inositol 2-dehydrogenase (NADP+)
MRENKVIYGLIGYGGMGRWHTEILSNVPEAVIGGIYDIKEEKREEAKEKGFFVYETEEAMLADPDIDVVLIATPNDCHKPIAIRAMHAGKNVISEKPVTLSSTDLLEMENAINCFFFILFFLLLSFY